MSRDRFDPETADAVLDGRLADGADGAVVALVATLRGLAATAPEPSAELASLFETGQPAVAPPASARASWRRRLIRAAAANVAGLGLLAKLGVGAAVATTGVVGAGAAGVLPDPVQHIVARSVGAVTPFRLPDSTPAPAVSEDADSDHAHHMSTSPSGDPTAPPAGVEPASEADSDAADSPSDGASDMPGPGRAPADRPANGPPSGEPSPGGPHKPIAPADEPSPAAAARPDHARGAPPTI